MPSKFAVNSSTHLISIQGQLKVSSREESGCIVTHENMHFSYENYETRRSKLADENAKCCVAFERSYSYLRFHPLAARLPELASKLERLDRSHLFKSEHRSKLSTDYSSGER